MKTIYENVFLKCEICPLGGERGLGMTPGRRGTPGGRGEYFVAILVTTHTARSHTFMDPDFQVRGFGFVPETVFVVLPATPGPRAPRPRLISDGFGLIFFDDPGSQENAFMRHSSTCLFVAALGEVIFNF